MRTLVQVSHALADKTRWRLLSLLSRRILCVCELADILGMPQSSVSSHLQIIRKAGLLESERCGKWMFYTVAPSHRPFLSRIAETFPPLAEEQSVLDRDAARAGERVTMRGESCGPLPKRLSADLSNEPRFHS